MVSWWIEICSFLGCEMCPCLHLWTIQWLVRERIRYYDNKSHFNAITVCYRWVCKMIKKKFKSTVLCCSFHPSNGQLLATGCADFKCRIFSTYASDVDGTDVSSINPGPFTGTTGPMEFGEAYVELNALGWVHAVAWSPSGLMIAYASKLFSKLLFYNSVSNNRFS